MKNIQKSTLALLVLLMTAIYSCGPNDHNGSMSQSNSKGEGSIDSTRLTNFDSTNSSTGKDTSNIK